MKTAFITGATEGIGYELSQLFARDGYRLIIVARNEAKLAHMVQQWKQQGIDAYYYANDLSDLSQAQMIYADLQRKGITPDCVVNNAGFGTSGHFTDIDWKQELRMMQLNIITLAYFTKQFAHDMKQRKHGRIMNVASTASFLPVPYMAAYAGTKAFVRNLSEALAFELKGTGVTITCLCPGVTESKFHQTANTVNTLQKARLLPQATAADTAAFAYKAMMKGKTLAIHKLGNQLSVFAERFLPRCIITRMAASTTI
ncbi:MAG: SDR family oxidoreductase [Paludibacteraceae bacterium]|nr:SDR family oxidoreductase [Paludibacteraceae bacterium]